MAAVVARGAMMRGGSGGLSSGGMKGLDNQNSGPGKGINITVAAMIATAAIGLLLGLIGIIVYFAKVKKDSGSDSKAKDASFVLIFLGALFVGVSVTIATVYYGFRN